MKKNIIRLLTILGCVILLASCNKETVTQNDRQVGISTITYYPDVAIIGARLIILNQGATYTDPGVTCTINGAPVTPTITGTVNTGTPGVYNIVYSATNADGYSASDWRTVVVIGNDVAANDFSGTYLRAATGVTSSWTKTAKGVYTVDNPGGAVTGVGYDVIAVNYTGNKIAIPKQLATDPSSGSTGAVSSGSESYSTAAPIQYSWVFFAGGYGTGLRTFVKQ